MMNVNNFDRSTSFTISETICVSVSKVWTQIINTENFNKWLTVGALEVVSSFNENDPIEFKGLWNRLHYHDKGKILVNKKESLLRYSYFSPFSKLKDVPENYSIFEFHLEPIKENTLLTITVSNLINPEIYGHVAFFWRGAIKRIKQEAEQGKQFFVK